MAQENDKESNYSFVLGKELNNMTNMLDNCNIREKSVHANADMSIEVRSQKGAQNQNYDWNGGSLGQQAALSTGWSYSRYMDEKEAEEERTLSQKRAAKIEVITID